MSIELLTAAIFLAVAVLIFAGLWVVFIAPAAGRQMRRRLAAIQQTAEYDLDEAELQFVRDRAMSSSPALDRILVQMKSLRKLQLYIAQSGVEITVMTLIGISFGLAVFTYLICVILQLWIFSVVLAVCIATIPGLYIGYKRYRRFWEFEQQFPDSLEMLTRAVRAGYAFTSALRLIADEMPDPVAEEFRATYEQQNLGLPLRDALTNMGVRVPLPDVHIFVSALQIQRETGGNLAEILENLSAVVRERFKLLRQVRVYTAEGRMSLVILTAVPPFLALLFILFNRQYLMPLFTDPLGQKMLVGAVILQIIGFLVLKKITTLKV